MMEKQKIKNNTGYEHQLAHKEDNPHKDLLQPKIPNQKHSTVRVVSSISEEEQKLIHWRHTTDCSIFKQTIKGVPGTK